LPIAGIANRRSLLYVGNAVSAIDAALGARGLAGDVLPIADAEAISTRDLAGRLASALRVEPRLFALPASFLRGAAAIVGRSADAARLLDSLEVDAAQFRGLTGWKPPYSLDEGLLATAAWWRKEHPALRR
jgi:UDP-glucose 4-epimerase